MLHPDVAAEIVADHAVAPDGVALLTAPGVPLVRLRSPMTSYGAYLAAVEAGRDGNHRAEAGSCPASVAGGHR